MADPLQCTYEDARRNHLHDGIAMSVQAKVAYFEEMVSLLRHFGARDWLAGKPARTQADATTLASEGLTAASIKKSQ